MLKTKCNGFSLFQQLKETNNEISYNLTEYHNMIIMFNVKFTMQIFMNRNTAAQ